MCNGYKVRETYRLIRRSAEKTVVKCDRNPFGFYCGSTTPGAIRGQTIPRERVARRAADVRSPVHLVGISRNGRNGCARRCVRRQLGPRVTQFLFYRHRVF